MHDRAEIFRFQGGKIDQFHSLIRAFGKRGHAGAVVDSNAMSQLYQAPRKLIDGGFESAKASGNRFYPDHCNAHKLRFPAYMGTLFLQPTSWLVEQYRHCAVDAEHSDQKWRNFFRQCARRQPANPDESW